MEAARSLLASPWAIALDPARRDGRVVAESAEPERAPRRVALPSSLDPGLAEALRAVGIERLYSHQATAAAAAAGADFMVTTGTASGKGCASTCRCSTARSRDPHARAPSTSTPPRRSPRTSCAASALGREAVETATYDGDTRRRRRAIRAARRPACCSPTRT